MDNLLNNELKVKPECFKKLERTSGRRAKSKSVEQYCQFVSDSIRVRFSRDLRDTSCDILSKAERFCAYATSVIWSAFDNAWLKEVSSV